MAFGMWFLYLAVVPVVAVAVCPQDHSMSHMATHDENWAALMKNMETMHAAMAHVEPSGNHGADFVNMMLPHHEAAVDMENGTSLWQRSTDASACAGNCCRPRIRNSVDAALA